MYVHSENFIFKILGIEQLNDHARGKIIIRSCGGAPEHHSTDGDHLQAETGNPEKQCRETGHGRATKLSHSLSEKVHLIVITNESLGN